MHIGVIALIPLLLLAGCADQGTIDGSQDPPLAIEDPTSPVAAASSVVSPTPTTEVVSSNGSDSPPTATTSPPANSPTPATPQNSISQARISLLTSHAAVVSWSVEGPGNVESHVRHDFYTTSRESMRKAGPGTHEIRFSNLHPDQTYSFQVVLTGPSGAYQETARQEFKTHPAPQVRIVHETMTNNSITITAEILAHDPGVALLEYEWMESGAGWPARHSGRTQASAASGTAQRTVTGLYGNKVHQLVFIFAEADSYETRSNTVEVTTLASGLQVRDLNLTGRAYNMADQQTRRFSWVAEGPPGTKTWLETFHMDGLENISHSFGMHDATGLTNFEARDLQDNTAYLVRAVATDPANGTRVNGTWATMIIEEEGGPSFNVRIHNISNSSVTVTWSVTNQTLPSYVELDLAQSVYSPDFVGNTTHSYVFTGVAPYPTEHIHIIVRGGPGRTYGREIGYDLKS